MNGLRLLNDYVLVQMEEVPEKKGSIYLPESVVEKEKRRLCKGIVRGCGKMVNPEIQRGQRCILDYYAGEEFMIDNVFYKIVKDENIVLIMEE